MPLNLLGGRVLLPDGNIETADIHIADGTIAEFAAGDGPAIDAAGHLVLPGIVDNHGDGFERHIMPRAGVDFPLPVALADADRQLLSSGITTAFFAQGLSWEGGLRGAARADALITAINARRHVCGADIRVHIRHEVFALDDVDTLIGWIAGGRIDMLVFNDHLPDFEAMRADTGRIERYAAQAGCDVAAFLARMEATRRREAEVPDTLTRIAAAAAEAWLPLGSHDDDTPDRRRRYQALGASMAEFPVNRATAAAGRELDNPIIMGAPNVLRGGSSLGNVSATDLIADGLCDVLVSDYYYPAPLHAAFRLTRDGMLPLARAWALVSANPAAVAGLADRGAIAVGKRADLIVVDDSDADTPRVVGTLVRGRPAAVTQDLFAAI